MGLFGYAVPFAAVPDHGVVEVLAISSRLVVVLDYQLFPEAVPASHHLFCLGGCLRRQE